MVYRGRSRNDHAVWDASAGRLGHDLGWTPACARSGTRPACRLAPAIQFIGYDGYPGRGSPRTCRGGCPAHLHLSWASPCYGTSNLSPPCEWVMEFAVLPAGYPPGRRATGALGTAGITDSHPATRAMRASAGSLCERSGRTVPELSRPAPHPGPRGPANPPRYRAAPAYPAPPPTHQGGVRGGRAPAAGRGGG